jgi:hypothetical protein
MRSLSGRPTFSFASSLLLYVAVVCRADERDAGSEAIRQRAGERSLELELIIRAHREAGVGAQRIAGAPRHELDRAADRVLAVERALRAAQDLDAIHVKEVELVAANTGKIDVVDIDADGRVESLECVGLADAANVDVRRVRRATALDDVEVRNRALKAGRVRCLDPVESALIESGDRSRNALQALLSSAGGNDDRRGCAVLPSIVRSCSRLRSRRLRRRFGGRLSCGLRNGRSGGECGCGDCAEQSGTCDGNAHLKFSPWQRDPFAPAVENQSY